MIGFSCIYCGQEIPASPSLAGQRIECPACGHSLMVRPNGRGEGPGTPPDPGDNAGPKEARGWEGKTNQEIVQEVFVKALTPEEKRKREARRYLSCSLARYDDLTLFVLSAALMLLLLLNADTRRDLLLVSFLPRIGVFVILALAGMVLSFLHIFVRTEKHEYEKRLMVLFAVLVTGATGIYTSYVMLKGGPSWLMIFPAWNAVSSGVLLLEFYGGLITADSIIDARPSFRQVVVAAASALLLVLVCQYVFELHWAVTYSVVVCYTMSLLGTIEDLFGPRPGHDVTSGVDS